MKNARFALNAANARWGSLYDAVYGTDVISKEGELAITKEYNEKRGALVVEFAKKHLDFVAPLKMGSHLLATSYKIVNNELEILLNDGRCTSLKDKQKCIGFYGDALTPSAIILKNNNFKLIKILLLENLIKQG